MLPRVEWVNATTLARLKLKRLVVEMQKIAGSANGTIWKSSNFTTTPFTLAPNDHQSFSGNGGGAAGNAQVKMPSKHSMGHKSITIGHQNNFSRGDSIGDISGEVRIHNTGTVPVTVTCG